MVYPLEVTKVTIDPRIGAVDLTLNTDIQILSANAAFYPDQYQAILHASGLVAPTLQRVLSDLLRSGMALWVGFVAGERTRVQIGVTMPDARNIEGLIERLTPLINAMNVAVGQPEIGTVEALNEVFTRNHVANSWTTAFKEMMQFLETHLMLAINAKLASPLT